MLPRSLQGGVNALNRLTARLPANVELAGTFTLRCTSKGRSSRVRSVSNDALSITGRYTRADGEASIVAVMLLASAISSGTSMTNRPSVSSDADFDADPPLGSV